MDSNWTPPSWYRPAKQQLKRMHRLWPSADLPDLPDFEPQTATEVPLLHAPLPFKNLWRHADGNRPPAGFKPVDRRDDAHLRHLYGVPLEDDGRAILVNLLRLVGIPIAYKTNFNWMRESRALVRTLTKPVPIDLDNDPNIRTHSILRHPKPVWLGFDPETRGPNLPENSRFAANEVFTALIQFPDWQFAWFNGASAPILMGYRRYSYTTPIGQRIWDGAPSLTRTDDTASLEMFIQKPSYRYTGWACPSVRVLS